MPNYGVSYCSEGSSAVGLPPLADYLQQAEQVYGGNSK
jgi:hypothetical protein